MDAIAARRLARTPFQRAEYRGWTVEVYRVGRKHEYQAVALLDGRPSLQTTRFGGRGASHQAGIRALMLIDQEIERRASLTLHGDPL